MRWAKALVSALISLGSHTVGAVAAILYVILALITEGRTLAWTFGALVWVWKLAPVPMSILMFGIPTAFLVALTVTNDLIPLKNDPHLRDKHRTNPPPPPKALPRALDPPQPILKRPITIDVEPVDLDSVINPPLEQPEKHRTTQKKPPTPKIWGIDP